MMHEQTITSTFSNALVRAATRLGSLLTVMILAFIASNSASAQDLATQDLSLSVNAFSAITTSGDPEPLIISDGVAGTNALTSASDGSTTYDITQNHSTGRARPKIAATLNSPLPAGYTLKINLASTLGRSAGTIDISKGRVRNVVTALANGADADQSITYTFSANASSGTLAPTVKTVTLTVTN